VSRRKTFFRQQSGCATSSPFGQQLTSQDALKAQASRHGRRVAHCGACLVRICSRRRWLGLGLRRAGAITGSFDRDCCVIDAGYSYLPEI
jgi:hypothetical protein